MKIAIVGTGISGLTAASILNRRHDITVFEADNRLGGHSHTAQVNDQNRSFSIDTGFIVFNEHNYPNLCRLFDAIDVHSRESDMSFSVRCDKSGFEYNGSSVNTLISQRRNVVNPKLWSMLSDILRFHKDAPQDLTNGLDEFQTVAEYVKAKTYHKSFLNHYLMPLGASLWSCNAEQFREFPIRFVIEFLHNHNMLQVNDRPLWRTVDGGSKVYVDRLTDDFRDRIHLNTEVERIRRVAGRIELLTKTGDRSIFDEVVLASHADQSLKLISNAEEEERELLSCFPYQLNDVTLHTDTSIMPRQRRTWASWNYRVPEKEKTNVTVTYNMNYLQAFESEKTFCVSLNQNGDIDPTRILKRMQYYHPVFTAGRSAAQAHHTDMIRRRGISYCGAYWGYGFHEDGVVSALRVCDAFDMGFDS